MPRFEVVEVSAGNRRAFVAYDHLTKRPHYPLHSRSREEAFALVEQLAMNARAANEVLSVERTDTPAVTKPKS